MKAQILKIAGVKTEAEFYKKYPTEEAFMKKHGKELKKAQYGTYVAGQKEQPAQKPIAYNDIYQDTISAVTGVSKEERARQEALASQKAIAASNASSSQGQGFGDILKNIDPEMITSAISAIGGAKNGKKMKKAQNGLQGIIKPPAMPKVEMANLAKTKGFGLNKLEDIPASTDRGFDYAGAAKKIPGALGSQLGSIIGNIQQIEQNKKDIAKANQWADVSQVASQAALSRPEQSKRRYARPEDNLVTGMNPLGKKDSLLAAQNGAEIANTFAPNDIYTDLGYEPLSDSDPKQYAYGGHLPKAEGGFDFNSLSGVGGSLGGALGSAIGKGTGKGGPGSAIGSTIGGALGNLIPIPGVGSLIGSTLGGLAGGLFDAEDQNKLQEAQDRQTNAINQATIGKGVSNLQQANKAFMENGGYMNPEYNPQVIAKFGDYSMDQLLAPPYDADMLRAGGHLKEYTPPSARAMYTGRDLPYQMEYGGQMAMGGDLEVHRGQAETMSYNPFLPDGGETIMFKGPSHDNGGMPISYGNNGVEVEGGEPAIKLQDGGSPDGNLVVYGNMVIPEYGVAELGDKNAKGKKFKHYIADLSKIEAKQGKLIEKTTALINNADANDQFDKLSLNTGQANLIGTTMKLKEIAEKKKTAAAVQNAILDTAREMGVESDALAKGKIKYAKANDPYAEFGAKLQKGGKVKYEPEFENFIDQAMMLEQANSSAAGNYRGGGSNFGTNNANIKTPEQAKEFYYKNYWSKVKDLPAGLRTRALQLAINTGDPYGELMVASGKMSVKDRAATKDQRKDKAITGNKNWEANKKAILDEYNKDPQGFLGKLDAEQDRYYNSIIANNPSDINSDTRKEFFDDYVGLAKYASQPYIPTTKVAQEAAKSAMPINAPVSATAPIVASTPVNGLAGAIGLSPIAETLPGSYLPNLADQIAQARAIQNARYTTTLDDVQVVAPRLQPEPEPIAPIVQAPVSAPVVVPPVAKVKEPKGKKEKGKFPWDQVMTGVNSVLPFLRPSNQIPLDPSQLSGELYALSQNQEEPVFAQSYQPMLTQTSNISLQDQLNEITSQARSAERMAQGNPAALAMIASQAAEAKNKVLGEQFRLNQGEQQRVMETNRQTMNEAQKMNLGLFDQQQQRQAQAKSNTKMQNIVALNSINDKIMKQKSENRQVALMENLYNYRFTPNGVAYNMNPLAQFNLAGAGAGKGMSGDLETGKDFSYNKAGKIIGIHSVGKDDTKKNGGIVKAIKNL